LGEMGVWKYDEDIGVKGADLGEMGVWKYDEDIGVKGVAGDDHDEDKGDGRQRRRRQFSECKDCRAAQNRKRGGQENKVINVTVDSNLCQITWNK